jgi:2,3-bisphosphoglycerate-independent phosphoglycerate mutase
MSEKKVVLIIMDGWGNGDKSEADAIAHADTPFINSLYKKYPYSQLLTSGENVGLPEGQMGNSEVGHLNIGAGRIVYQDFAKINKEVKERTIDNNKVLNDAFIYAKQNSKDVHFIGLVSEGGVHSHQEHLYRLCEMAGKKNLQNIFIHAFTDGRDTDPKSGLEYLKKLEKNISGTPARIASVIGRYYAMDRDKRWERVKLAYDLLVKGVGKPTNDLFEEVKRSYNEGVTDEFIKPIVKVDQLGKPIALIKEGDVVICFNFRTDRCREITQALTQEDFPEQGMRKHDHYYVTMTRYDDSFKNVKIVFEKDNLEKTLGEVLSKAGKNQIRIAETEKYPHVTFFFSGGREEPFKNEKRIMIPSPKVATYDLKPEMSAYEVTDAIVKELETKWPDFVCLNFANPDMVAHTGSYKAVIKALETVDTCARAVVESGLKNGYSFIIIADHGNADYMINPDGSPNTAHSTNPVPCILIDDDFKSIRDGKLADLAPTILKMMSLPIPPEMTGEILV